MPKSIVSNRPLVVGVVGAIVVVFLYFAPVLGWVLSALGLVSALSELIDIVLGLIALQ